MGRKCEIYTCGNHQGNDSKSYFRFPRSEALCLLWVKACNSPEATKIFELGGVQAFRKKKICSDHFPPASFKDADRKNKGLVTDAVPITCQGYGVNQDESQNIFESLENDIDYLSDDPDYVLWQTHVNAEQLQAVSPTERYRLLADDGTTGLDDGEQVLDQYCQKIIAVDEKQEDEQIGALSQVVSPSGQCQPVLDDENNSYVDGEHLRVLSFDYFGQQTISTEQKQNDEQLTAELQLQAVSTSFNDGELISVLSSDQYHHGSGDENHDNEPVIEESQSQIVSPSGRCQPVQPDDEKQVNERLIKESQSRVLSSTKQYRSIPDNEASGYYAAELLPVFSSDHSCQEINREEKQNDEQLITGLQLQTVSSTGPFCPQLDDEIISYDDGVLLNVLSSDQYCQQADQEVLVEDEQLRAVLPSKRCRHTIIGNEMEQVLKELPQKRRRETYHHQESVSTALIELPSSEEFRQNSSGNVEEQLQEDNLCPHKARLRRLLKVEKETNRNLKLQLKSLRRQLFVALQTSNRRLQTAKRNKRIVAKLRTEVKALRKRKSAAEKLGEQAAANPIIKDSLSNASRRPKARRYHPTTMKFAAGIYLSGPRTYRYIRNSKQIILPHKSTVYSYNKDIRLEPGLNKVIMDRIKDKAGCLQTKNDKVVMICVDGMSVKSELTYCAKSDTFYGFPDHGIAQKTEKNDPTRLATEAVVVMVSGIYHSFKQPIGYLLAHNSLGSEMQMKLLKKSVKAIRETGLIPLALVMDQSTTNQKMVREVGATPQHPIIKVDGKEIAVMYDTPHLLKNARNAIYKHNAVFDGQIASFIHIEHLYEADVASTLRLVPKLQYKTIHLPPFTKMNVAMATRTLSESCAIGIHHYVETGTLPNNALQTASFVALHDKLFDTFNSKERYANSIGKVSNRFETGIEITPLYEHKFVVLPGAYCSDNNDTCRKLVFPYRAPITDQSIHLNFLTNTLQILKTMYYTVNTCFNIRKAKKQSLTLTVAQRQPAYLKGFIGNINALTWIWNVLKTNYRCNYLCTNPFCQDCLENFFSEIRRRCGFNDAPNVFQFSSAFKYAMISASNDSSNSSNEGMNCKDDKVPSLLNENDLEDISLQEPRTHCFEFEPLDVDTPSQFLKKDLNALVYILGAAIRKLPHQKCRTKLKAEQDDDCLQNEDYSFSKLKAQLSTHQTNIPNNTLYDIGIVAFAVFKQKFKKFLFENRRDVKLRMKQYVTYDHYGTSICKSCFAKLMDCIFNTFIQGFLRENRFKNKIAEKNKRRTKRNRKAIRMNLTESLRP